MATRRSKDKEKWCNICGESVLKYIVVENAPLCERCVPMKKQKKIMDETGMVNKILGKN